MPDVTSIDGGSYNSGREPLAKSQAEKAERGEATTDDINSYRRELKLIRDDARDTRKTVTRMENITYLGFIVLIFMLMGLVFVYIEFVYSGSKNDDYKYDLSRKLSDSENEIKILKICLNTSGWLNPQCFKN